MTVIRFEDKENSSVIKPGVNNALSRVFDAVVKYCLKQNLPKSADRDELIFTTDTHEFFRGNGKGLDLIPFNTVLLFDAVGNFPDVGIESKIYVDKSTSLMFTWNGTAYAALTSGENGEIIISPSDAKIGDLTKLATKDKATVVAAINEVFNALVTIDIDSVITQIESMEIDITDIKNTLANGDVSAIAKLEVKIGDLATLTTAEKTSLVGAINELRTLIGSGSAGGDAEIAVIVGVLSQLKTADKTNVVAAINEIFVDVEALELSITAIQGSQTTIENEVTVLQNTVETIDNSITQINSIIGTLSSLTTVEKTSIVAAINELVIQIGSLDQDVTDLSALTNQVNQIVTNIGTLSALSTTAKANLVAAINELVGRITGVDGEITAIKGSVSAIESNIDEVEKSVATNTQSITALSERTTSVENRMTSLEGVNLTAEDKQKYLEYQDLVQSLLDEMVPELQGRISILEQEVANLKTSSGGGTPPDGGGGTDPTEPTALWSHEFVLPVGVATYELGEDPEYVANGHSFDMMTDLYGETQKVRLYSLGNAGEAPTEPAEVPLVGTGGTPPTEHGVWESYTSSDVVFEVASLIAWRFRLVKYA